jgi:hypothetical protein
MANTAAMVQVMVMKGGGAGTGTNMGCPEILACFDPQITFGPHSQMQGSLANYQAEHIVPTSAFHRTGRSGDRIPGCRGYSTPAALTWMVHDGQSHGTEHRLLTDPMREFSQANSLAGRQGTLNEWLDRYEAGARNALRNADPRRRITRSDLDQASLFAAAAECIRASAAQAFAEMGIEGNTQLRNSWDATAEQRRAADAVVDTMEEAFQ